MSKKIFSRSICSVLILVFFFCVVVVSFFTVIRWVDWEICTQRTAKKIGVEPTYEGIRSYLENSMFSGMERDVIVLKLKELGPVDIDSEERIGQPGIIDTIRIKMCLHPLNHFLLFVSYTEDGRLEYFKFDDD